ncbi:uncharacterized protein LOC110486361 [Oncorhynchus mykiss]|nr:uncharacterized protein LOC110486361 [Oncorhynchus mykiss]
MRATLLCLLCMAMCLTGIPASPVRKAQKNNQAAPIDDMNVLMYGVLQFSETLHHVYESTDAKFARIERSLRRHEERLERLGQEAGQAAEKDRQMRQVLGQIQGQMAGLQSEAEEAEGKVARVEQEEGDLRTKVINLETYLQNYPPNSIQELKDRALKHSRVLEGLLTWTQFQKQSIESQNQQLTKLQKLSEARRQPVLSHIA